MRREFRPDLYPVLIGCLFLLAACGQFSGDAALEDCDVRARASGGEYVASAQLCFHERHHVEMDGARQLANGLATWHRAVGEDDQRLRNSEFDLYASYLRLARFHGVDSGWVERRIKADSARLIQIYPR